MHPPVPYIGYCKLNLFSLRGRKVEGRNMLGLCDPHVLRRAPGHVPSWEWPPPPSTPPVTSKTSMNPNRISLHGCAGKRTSVVVPTTIPTWELPPPHPLWRSHHPSGGTATTKSLLEESPSQQQDNHHQLPSGEATIVTWGHQHPHMGLESGSLALQWSCYL